MGIVNQAVQTGTLSMPHPEYSYITLASPNRLYSARENLFEPPGFEPALKLTEAEVLTNRLRPQNYKLHIIAPLVKSAVCTGLKATGAQICLQFSWQSGMVHT